MKYLKNILNQKNEKLSTGSKIYFGDTIIVKAQSNAQILLLDETALTVGEKSEITIDEFEDFMADILGLCESFEEMVYEFEGNINLSPEYLERVYPEEKESLEKLKNQIQEHKDWKEKHQASYSFLTRKLLEKNESDNNEKNT